jgi:peptidoglycan/LPS O-acetylase OafA/YrhL
MAEPNPPLPSGRPGFRSDIEGLRGAAILLVVGFHAGVSFLAGGFVGVDVFFVLSGFLITGLLARELTQNGELDVTGFYARRDLRLLPALLIVLFATLALVSTLYAPIDRAEIAASARSVALFAGNIEFARNSLDYFSSGDNPLLHTWSLGVEQQFYLVWPLLFVVVALIFGQKMAEDETVVRKRLLMAVGLAAATSFVASFMVTRSAQHWAFFGMPTRIWEFALGGMVALGRDVVLGRGLWPRVGSRLSASGTALQAFGAMAIALAVLLYDRSTAYPGLAALLPALGTIALLIGGENSPTGPITRALSADWLRWFGRMSYGWYLWHWPLVGLGSVLDWQIGVVGRLAWSGLALLLAWITYRLIEEPTSTVRGWISRVPARWATLVTVGAAVAAAGIAHWTMIAAERRVARPDQRVFAAARADRVADACWTETLERVKLCEFGDRASPTTLVLLGDSHAQHWIAGLDRAGRERGWRIVAMVKGGCPVAHMQTFEHPRLKRLYFECTRYREEMLGRIITMRPAAVILSSWDHYMPRNGKGSPWQVTPAVWRDGLRDTYSRLAKAGIRTVAIRGTPRTWFDVPSCLSRKAARLPFARNCGYDRSRALAPLAVAAQNEAARGLPVRFVDMNDAICSTSRCPVIRNGVVMFTDDNHLTASFTRSLAPLLATRLSAAMR